ncbi:Fe-S cluster assembly protein SufD [Chryseolinea sp. T2]|uniref:Fe-S cluster assembly protein SufD n=1 Tax=Chryseolinea sp. T2 TaxID=3129255 RepID=UPI0030772466
MSDKSVIDLIDQQVGLHPRITALREKGREAFLKNGLPHNKEEEFKHTPITRLLQKNLSLEPKANKLAPLSAEEFRIEGLDAYKVVFVNGIYDPTLSSLPASSDVVVKTLADAVDDGDALALEHLGKYADPQTDGFVAWNTAAWTNGVFIHAKRNAIVDKPVYLVYWHNAEKEEVVSVVRNLLVVETNAQLEVFERYGSSGKAGHFSNHVTEAVVLANGGLDLYTLQNDNGQRYQYAFTRIHQEPSSRVNTYTFTFDGKLVRNTLQLALDGQGIESHMFGLYLLSGDTIADNHTVVDHRQPNSFSNEIYKGILDDNSKGVFNGKIYVRPQAQKTNAFQANRNILMSDSATVNTKPQLEIWADDVKCSHGCTTGQLDEEAIFYLQARGIDKETARAMMLFAFALEILDNIKHAGLRHYIEAIIRERLHQ